jgi:NhaP-type Na+/H+ or K+/H+ antiporter
VILFLILLARPLTAFISTCRDELSIRERLYLAFMGPKGINAAAVAPLALSMGVMGGERIVAITFLAILITVAMATILAKIKG